MVLKKNKKGQAAIEFLMTYGWMLLVVLIVGALIFSFVDFGSLLPNQLDLSNSLRADATQMVASAGTPGNVSIVFTYLGTRAGSVNAIASGIERDVGNACTGQSVRNIDTSNTEEPNVQFINGQLGIITFECDSLVNGDTLEGQVAIEVTNDRTGLDVMSRGRLRLKIDE